MFGADERRSCVCEICRQKVSFSAPSELVNDFVDGKVVLIAGAGISTENRRVIQDTFYEHISHLINSTDLNRPFPEVMEEFCRGPAGRAGLVIEVKKRFDYIYSHREIYHEATAFHRELATFYPIDTIVTTNWDPYFEDECAATAFVGDADIALWEAATRKVLKIHGTINQFGSIVATTRDYDRSRRRLEKGTVGALLKTLLATRTTIFVGYSLKDSDFLQIYDTVRRYLAEFHKPAYFVTPTVDQKDKLRLSDLNLNLIETDGTYFIEKLKEHAFASRCMNPDFIYDRAAGLLETVRSAHVWLTDNFNVIKYPQTLFSACYQDGLMQALERVIRQRKTGEYSDRHYVLNVAASYGNFAQRYKKDKKFTDAAYCEGYANGMFFAIASGLDKNGLIPPLFFHFGNFETWSRTAYKRAVRKLPSLHKASDKYARKVTSKYKVDDQVVIHHPPQLDLGRYIDKH